MKTSKSPLLIAAAFTGLLGGAMARANAAPTARKRRAHRAIPRPSLKSMLRRAGKGGCATDGKVKKKS
jgi:hypothetical protein